MATISEQSAQAIFDACVKRGPNKGFMLKNAPRSNTLAYAAWQAHMMAFNPFKVSITAFLFMTPEQKAVYEECLKIFEDAKARGFRGVDRDRLTLENMGAW